MKQVVVLQLLWTTFAVTVHLKLLAPSPTPFPHLKRKKQQKRSFLILNIPLFLHSWMAS